MPELSREETFAEFAWQTTRTSQLGEVVRLILETAQTTIGADGAGVTMIRAGGALGSFGETTEAVLRSDQLQHRLREGPCVEAAVEVHNVASGDLAVDPRWPHWGPQAAGLGLRSVLSATLHTAGDRRLGALNVYGHGRQQFTASDLETVRLFAAHATAALWTAAQISNLDLALDTRTRIGQATGLLMQRYGLTADQATNVLKRYSQQTNTKLRALAEDVIAHRGLPGDAATQPPDA